MKSIITNSLLLTAIAASALVGCGPMPASVSLLKNHGSVSPADNLISVTQGGTIVAKNARIELAQAANSRARHVAAATPFDYTIDYVSQVPAPTLNGRTLQADDVAICGCGDTAYIAYNTQGGAFAGAIQMLDVTNKAHPAILKEIKFDGISINALYHEGSTLYFGGYADADRWHMRALVGQIDLTKEPTGAAIGQSIHALKSFAVTSIAKHANVLYVGVGAKDGGIEALDATSLKELAFFPRADVRSVSAGQDGVLALAGTTDGGGDHGNLLTVDDTLKQQPSETALPNFKSDYAKATVELRGDGLVDMALSANGFEVRGAKTHDVVYSLANPSSNPLDATNGASSDNGLTFIANGEYGFRVVEVLDATKTGSAFAKLAGYHQMTGAIYDGKRYSANFVRYRAEHLFVADGLGGVNIYALTKH